MVLMFGIEWNGAPSCVGDCMANRIAEAEVCGTGVAPNKTVVGRVVRMGYARCCGQCGGNLSSDMRVCRMM